ncbi:MAG: carboxypeptidase regulatory-like domain-containing protein [Fuerstiella sp.]
MTNLKSEGALMKNLTLTVLTVLMLAPAGLAAEWGTISGRVVLKGDVPDPVLLHAKGAPVKDGEICADVDTYKGDLVIDKETKGIANVFLYIYKAPKDIHPQAAKPAPKVKFDQKNCKFIPHVLVVQAGQTVEVLNSDPIAHNTHTYPLRNQATNILLAPNTKEGEGVGVATVVREIVPHQVKCDFHPWMVAHWLVLDHPYAVATDAEGKFKMENLPVGDHELRIWHERVGYLDRAYKVSVSPGDNSPVEPIEYELSVFEEK